MRSMVFIVVCHGPWTMDSQKGGGAVSRGELGDPLERVVGGRIF